MGSDSETAEENIRGISNKMIYEQTDTSKAKYIFDGWKETMIYSCLQKVMGKICL